MNPPALDSDPLKDIIRVRLAASTVNTPFPDRREWVLDNHPRPLDRLNAKCLETKIVLVTCDVMHDRFLYANYSPESKANMIALLNAADKKRMLAQQLVASFENEMKTIETAIGMLEDEVTPATAEKARNAMIFARHEVEELEMRLVSAVGDPALYDSIMSSIAEKQTEVAGLTKRFSDVCAALKKASAQPAAPVVDPKFTMSWTRPPVAVPPPAKKVKTGPNVVVSCRPFAFTPVAGRMLQQYPTTNGMEVVDDPMLCLALYYVALAHGVASSTYTGKDKPPIGTIRIRNKSRHARIAPMISSTFYLPVYLDYTVLTDFKFVFLQGLMLKSDKDQWVKNGGKLLTEKDCMPYIEPYMAHARAAFTQDGVLGKEDLWKVVYFHTRTHNAPMHKLKFITYLEAMERTFALAVNLPDKTHVDKAPDVLVKSDEDPIDDPFEDEEEMELLEEEP
jgi:hypothetical protein